MTWPTVMVGCPIRDREWSVPLWMGGLLGLRYPHELLTLTALVNDSTDRTAAACEWWCREARAAGFRGARVGHQSFGTTVDNNARRSDRDYLAFAKARDAWVNLRCDEEWLLAVDSDIAVPPELLTRLVELATAHDLRMLSAVIDNSQTSAANWFHTNCLEKDRKGQLWHIVGAKHDRSEGVKPCDLTGACVLLHRSIFDAGVRYAVEPFGPDDTEDTVFCAQLRALGIRPHYAPSVRATHHMIAPEDRRYLSCATWHRRQARYHAEMAEVIDAEG